MMNQSVQNSPRPFQTATIIRFLGSALLHWVLMGVGVILRLVHFLENRSLWSDEASLALDVICSSFSEVLQFIQIFPEQPKCSYLFYLAVKAVTGIFGDSEMVLRLIPLVSGILAIPLFYRIVRRFMDPLTVTIALTFFIFSDFLIYYAAELRQYSSDMLLTLIMYDIYLKDRVWTKGYVLGLIVFGMAVIWGSFSGSLVLISLGILYFIDGMVQRKKDWRQIVLLTLVFGYNFYLVYEIAIKPMTGSDYLLNAIQGGFIQGSILTVEALHWIKEAWLNMVRAPLGLQWPAVGLTLILMGAVITYSRDRRIGTVLLLPLILCFVCSLFKKYPFFGRHLLFMTPILIILIAQAIGYLMKLPRSFGVLGVLLWGVLLWHPVQTVITLAGEGRGFEEMRPVMQYFKKNYRPSDAIYMNSTGQFPYWYYVALLDVELPRERTKIWRDQEVYGHKVGRFWEYFLDDQPVPKIALRYKYDYYSRDGYFRHPDYDIENHPPEANPRTWVILSHISPAVQAFILDYFESRGELIDRFEGEDSFVYLYDLSANQKH